MNPSDALKDWTSTLKEIKQKVWHRMDGATAASLREKGVRYAFALGLSIPHLREIAADYPHDKGLATALLNHEMRELKLLGVMLYPTTELTKDSLLWIAEQCATTELRDHVAFHLLAESNQFDELARVLLSKNSPEWLDLVLNASSRRMIKKAPIQEATLQNLLKRLNTVPVTSHVVHFLAHLEDNGLVYHELQTMLHEWLLGSDYTKREVAQTLLPDLM